MKSIITALISFCFIASTYANRIQQDTLINQEDSIVQKAEKVSKSDLFDYDGQTAFFTLDEEIISSDVTEGSTIDFVVRTDVRINDNIFLQKGAIAEGEITAIDKDNDEKPTWIKIQIVKVQTIKGNTINVKSKEELFKFAYDKDNGIIQKGKNMSGQLVHQSKPTHNDAAKEKPIIKTNDIKTSKSTIRIYSGVDIDLETKQTYKADELKQGMIIPLKVITPIKTNNTIVVGYEALATAEVIQINNSAFGKEIEIKLIEVVAVDGQKIPLRGNFDYEEKEFSRKIEMSGYTRSSAEVVVNKSGE